MVDVTPTYDDAQRQTIHRRTLGVLFASSIFGRAAMSMSFAVAALLIKEILGSGTWAGASTAAVTVGTAFSASILSNYMNRKGRRPGLTIGLMAATAGGIIAVVGGQQLSLVVFLVGIVFIGVGQGATNLARYAAADLAPTEGRGKAISLVVFASTVGAVGGPALVGLSGRFAVWQGLNELVGPFMLSSIFFGLSALILWVFLRPDPLMVSGGLRSASSTSKGGFGPGWAAIMAQPRAQLAVVGLALSQAVMVMVMAMTPLHMDAHGHELGIIGLILSTHTAGMFAFAPVAGWASDRFGRLITLGLGGALLVLATVLTALAGEAPALLMFPGLFFLGLGWSFGMVSSSALLTDSVTGDQQVPAQGAADFITSFTSGAGALVSGLVFTMAGFHILSMMGIAASGVILVFCFYRFRLDGLSPMV